MVVNVSWGSRVRRPSLCTGTKKKKKHQPSPSPSKQNQPHTPPHTHTHWHTFCGPFLRGWAVATRQPYHPWPEEPSSVISERCTRARINSAIFVSSEGKGFDSIEFIRRYGSQSVLCRKAKSAENVSASERQVSVLLFVFRCFVVDVPYLTTTTPHSLAFSLSLSLHICRSICLGYIHCRVCLN